MLYIIPTPIGNLDDITYRCVNTLQKSELIIVESFEKSKKLFQKYNVSAPIVINNVFNESNKLDYIISKIQSVEHSCLISDSGTPGISDPGFLIIRKCVELQIPVSCLPGPTALIPALIQSGFACEKFVFEGFLPRKKKKKRLEFLSTENRTIIIYESPYRLLKTLQDLNRYFQDRNIVVVKELTKIYESIYRGNIKSVIADLENANIKGEYIIVIQGFNN